MFVLEVIFGLVACIVVFLWWWQRSARIYWEKNGVSYISGPPLIGALKDVILFRKSFGELFMDLYNHKEFKYDPITGVYFFHKPSLIIRHPEIIKNILVKDFQNFVDRGISSDPHEDGIGRENLFAAKGSRWKYIRMKISPVFTSGKLKNLFLLMLDVAKALDQKLSTEVGKEPKQYEMKELASLFTTDTISICAFGVEANSLNNPQAEFRLHAHRAMSFNWRRAMEFTGCFLLPELATILRFALFSKETNQFMRSTIHYVMEERIKSGTKRNDLIDTLIMMKETDGDLFKGDTLVAQAAIFLIAGYETSSSAIAFTLFELARHPEVQEKLRKEVRAYAEKYGSLQYETINEMEYLHMVMKESLRLYPSLPFLDRVCVPVDGKKSYSLEPYHKFEIPRGMPIYIPVSPIHRDPKNYTDPDKFIPERFSAENKDSIDQYNYLSFGIGPRNCIGSRFGYFQVKLALFTIIKDYKVEVCEKTPTKIVFNPKSLIVQSLDPIYLNLNRI
uniref:Putative cytochrome p450 6g1-like protein n=1 Tax=Phlebotomus kandelakii TaxID=1109342 RepID=A0A6B2E8P4_9DIPT